MPGKKILTTFKRDEKRGQTELNFNFNHVWHFNTVNSVNKMIFMIIKIVRAADSCY